MLRQFPQSVIIHNISPQVLNMPDTMFMVQKGIVGIRGRTSPLTLLTYYYYYYYCCCYYYYYYCYYY